jgi:hypothetical protein
VDIIESSSVGVSGTWGQGVSTTEQGSTSVDIIESSSTGVSGTWGQDVSTTEQGSTSVDIIQSSSVGVSGTWGQDVSSTADGLHPADGDSSTQSSTDEGKSTINISATTEQVRTTEFTGTESQECDVKDISLLYAQYVLRTRGGSSDGDVLISGHDIPLQFIVSVLELQGTDPRDVTIDNLRNITLLYIMYDLN